MRWINSPVGRFSGIKKRVLTAFKKFSSLRFEKYENYKKTILFTISVFIQGTVKFSLKHLFLYLS